MDAGAIHLRIWLRQGIAGRTPEMKQAIAAFFAKRRA
jgi:hypothetical protein